MAKPRNLHIDGLVWRYAVGKTAVAMWDPNGHKTTVPLTDLTRRSQAAIDSARAIGPAERPRVPVAKRREMSLYNREFNARMRADYAVGRSQPGSRFQWRPLSDFLRPEKVTGAKRDWYGPIGTPSGVMPGMIRPSDVKAWIETRLLGKPAPSSHPDLLCSGCLTDVRNVRMQTDPFASEINGDDTQIPLCDDCADRSAQDI